ncbi:CPBP family intramembrane glutamic endopeptidase [Planococcus lenghuensis]|uniref:CAAX protease family protein n=1 Tax=Planococcus lenghuensis TaxID=2213202 RepID=A0A1Q2KWL3_9BACL|nr:type II CAAX endopeptidase family protein [Planococcus lenghuensis]AQQ52197.1 CAAX protease family protein [Planococcus lenghuensis]
MFWEMKTRYLILYNILAIIVMVVALLFIDSYLFTVSDDAVNTIFMAILYIIVPVLYFGYYFRKQNRPVQGILFTAGMKEWIPRLAVLVFILIAFSLSVFWLQLAALMPIAPWLVELFMEPVPMTTSPGFLVLEILFLAVIGPIAEEFMFRGVLLNRMIRKTSMWGGILISSILFGVLHADVLGAFMFGVITSLLFIKTRNLLVPVMLHIFNNSLAVLAAYVAPTFPEALALLEPADIYEKALPNAAVLIIASILLGLFLTRLVRSMKPAKRSGQPSVS